MTCDAFMPYDMGLGVVLFVFHLDGSFGAAGLPIGINKFCRLPTVTGDCVTFIGDVP